MKLSCWTKVFAAFVVGVFAVAGLRFAWYLTRSPDNWVVRGYQVEPAIAAEVARVLNKSLDPDRGFRMGGANLAADGTLIVTGPSGVQAGVARLIEDLSKRDVPPTPSIALDLWIVTGTPGPTARRGIDPTAELEPALASIRKARGELQFELLEHFATNTRAGGEDSSVGGARASLRLETNLRPGAQGKSLVNATIQVAIHCGAQPCINPPSLKSQIDLTPGELVVVGQSLASGISPQQAPGQEIYYIVRARL